MPLSWNEIRSRAVAFAREWEDETSERAESQTFWNQFFEVFGISRRRVAAFEKPVKTLTAEAGRIDLLWKGMILVEHKSKGRDLDKAMSQAKDYFPGLTDKELPRYILVSDFARFRLYNLEDDEQHDFTLKELPKKVELFGFMAGYEKRTYREEDPVNAEAALKMGELHDALKEVGYTGHELEVYLVRLLFCLFADDTGIFEKGIFQDYLEQRTSKDGSDLAMHLAQLFQVLDRPKEKRLKNLDDQLNQFPYVDGRLFEETLPLASFDSKMRKILIDACYMDWGAISPAIFGSLFQGVMNPEERRALGAHYTSEKNILKLIKPLFLDELRAEFEKAKGNSRRLNDFHNKLAGLKFFDPACGCGNFLVITYRELRELELEVLRELNKTGQQVLDIGLIIKIELDSFYGIEIDEWPARIAEVAMWLIDHQMNMKVSAEFGQHFARIPIEKSANIVHGNALRLDWEAVVPKSELSYILGNPPFVGAKFLSDEQRTDMAYVTNGISSAGLLDFVAGWYLKAADYIRGTKVEVGFVSTNSITQGEQVGVLWGEMLSRGVHINFAHRTFQWTSEARKAAAVYVVIIGFSIHERKRKLLYEYETPKSDAHEIVASSINPYLLDGPEVVIKNRTTPICDVPNIGIGNKPIDGGNYLFTPEEKSAFIASEPNSEHYFHRWLGAEEFLHNKERWCLWLGDCSPHNLREMPACMERVESVRKYRLASKSLPTRKLAATPTRFHVENMPQSTYLLIPEVTSERRRYVPIGFIEPSILASNLVKISSDATLYHFGVLTSEMHMTWMRYTAGRLESRYRYSIGIVYNNYPWPMSPTEKQVQAVEEAAQAVLDARALFPDSSLADLYDPVAMPPQLTKAHQELDKAVDKCYRPQPFPDERRRMEFLFELYEQYTSPLLAKRKKK